MSDETRKETNKVSNNSSQGTEVKSRQTDQYEVDVIYIPGLEGAGGLYHDLRTYSASSRITPVRTIDLPISGVIRNAKFTNHDKNLPSVTIHGQNFRRVTDHAIPLPHPVYR